MPSKPISRKDLILERAEQHFADHGYQGASLSAIARDCDVGNPGLLHHFPSKKLLYRAVLEKQAEELMARMQQDVHAMDGLRQRLLAFVVLQIEWMEAHPAGYRLVTRELLDNTERIEQAQARPLERFLSESLDLLEEAQDAGVVRKEIPAVVMLTIILGALNFAKIARPTFGKAFAEPALQSDSDWMKIVARDVLRVVLVEYAPLV